MIVKEQKRIINCLKYVKHLLKQRTTINMSHMGNQN